MKPFLKEQSESFSFTTVSRTSLKIYFFNIPPFISECLVFLWNVWRVRQNSTNRQFVEQPYPDGQVGHEPMTIVDWSWQLCLSRPAMSPACRSKCKQTHFFTKNLSFYEHISLLNYSWDFRSVKLYVTVPWHGSVAQSVERPKGPSLVQLYWLTRARFTRETFLVHLGIGVRKNRK